MGVLNATPDSFSDGGRFFDPTSARKRIDELLEQGVDVIDIGSESTRPGSIKVPADEQLRRALPSIQHALKQGAIVSVDTTDERVARSAAEEGVHLLNDVGCLRNEALVLVARDFGIPIIAMHSRGDMTAGSDTAMEDFGAYRDDSYGDVCDEVAREWTLRRDRAVALGVPSGNIWFDPGLGFHKNASQSFTLLARLREFRTLDTVVVVGPSRKSFLGSLDNSGPEQRLGGTLAACLHSVEDVEFLRVHDVREVRQALHVERTLRQRAGGSTERSALATSLATTAVVGGTP